MINVYLSLIKQVTFPLKYKGNIRSVLPTKKEMFRAKKCIEYGQPGKKSAGF